MRSAEARVRKADLDSAFEELLAALRAAEPWNLEARALCGLDLPALLRALARKYRPRRS